MRMFTDARRLNPPNWLPCSKTQNQGVGDACNREMGETFSGTRLSEATPRCLWFQVDTLKEDQTSLCVPTRPAQELSSRIQKEKLPYCYKSLAPIFTWERETCAPQYHALFFNFSTFSRLLWLFAFYCFPVHTGVTYL